MMKDSNRIFKLLARKFSGEATLQELQELDHILSEDPELSASVDMHQAYYEYPSTDDISDNSEQAWQRQLKLLSKQFPSDYKILDSDKEIKKQHHKKWKSTIWYAAAMLLIITGMSFLVLYFVSKKENNFKDEIVVKNDNGYKEPHVSHKIITLSDGTIIYLNKNSHLSYNKKYGIDNRNITITGEAFFDVAHNTKLPMVVHAGLINIKVKGTAFNISAYKEDNKVEASLVRGSIELTVEGNASKKVLMSPNEKIIVSVDSTFHSKDKEAKTINLTLDQLIPERKTGLIPELAWVDNKLVFNNIPFTDVVPKLERWYDVKITVKNEDIKKEKFTGVISTEKLETVLKALQMTYNFKYKINNNDVVIVYFGESDHVIPCQIDQ